MWGFGTSSLHVREFDTNFSHVTIWCQFFKDLRIRYQFFKCVRICYRFLTFEKIMTSSSHVKNLKMWNMSTHVRRQNVSKLTVRKFYICPKRLISTNSSHGEKFTNCKLVVKQSLLVPWVGLRLWFWYSWPCIALRWNVECCRIIYLRKRIEHRLKLLLKSDLNVLVFTSMNTRTHHSIWWA